jgi:hypothetical protein
MKLVLLAIVLAACGGGHKQTPLAASREGSTVAAPAQPANPPPATCDERVAFAMECFDEGAKAGRTVDCAAVAQAKHAPACDPAKDTCVNACGAAKAGDTRDHYQMLMTAPPP